MKGGQGEKDRDLSIGMLGHLPKPSCERPTQTHYVSFTLTSIKLNTCPHIEPRCNRGRPSQDYFVSSPKHDFTQTSKSFSFLPKSRPLVSHYDTVNISRKGHQDFLFNHRTSKLFH